MGLGFGKKTFKAFGFGWSYGGFMSFRKRLAKEIDIDLEEMDGFGGIKSWKTVESPIKLLLNHSDCDGVLSGDDCGDVYPELLKLIENWPPDDYDRITAEKLAKAMKGCNDNDDELIFC
jgi:hypothetical protein